MRRSVLIALVALVGAACSSAAPVAERSGTSPVADEIRHLADEIERIHPNPFHTVPRAEFRRRFEELAERAPALGRDELLVVLMRATVLGPRDGHSGLYPFGDHARPFHLYPIRLWEFPEGWFVVGSREHAELVGTRLVAIGGVPVDEIAPRVRPLVSYDNESSLALRVPEFAITPEVLRGLGLVERPEDAPLTFERRDGTRFQARLAPVPATEYVGRVVGDVMELWRPPAPPGVPKPPWLRRSGAPLWLTKLDRGRAIYVCYSMTTVSTFDFGERLARLARSPKVRRVVIDVRLNGGGDNTTYGSLVSALRRPPLNRRGLVVLLTGRVTFSAAGNFAAEVDAFTRARIVGEPAGGSPHQYGDHEHVELPFLGLTVYVAPEYVEVLGRNDERVELVPDVPVVQTAADFFAGRDPVLTTALRLR